MKKKNLYSIFLLLLLNFNLNGQINYKAYYLNLNKTKNFSDTDSILKYQLNALEFSRPLPKDLINIAFSYFKKKNISKASYYFCEAIKNGYQIEPDENYLNLPYKTEYDFGFISKYKDSKNIFADFMNIMYSKNKRKIKKLRRKFIKNIDVIEDSKYEVLLQNELNFQKIRMNILPNKQVPDSIILTLHKYLNIGNSYYMLDLLKNNDFPSRYKCRRFNDQTINMLLNHAISSFANKEDAKLFIDLLWKQVENGNLNPYDYAKAMDHFIQWYENSNYSLLGTTTISEDYKTFQCIDVLYPEKLDELRSQYWLESIEIFCRNTNFNLPKNYIKK